MTDIELIAQADKLYERTLAAYINDKERVHTAQLLENSKTELVVLALQCQNEEAQEHILHYADVLHMYYE